MGARRLGWVCLAAVLVGGWPAVPAAAEDGLGYDDFVTFERAVATDVNRYWARVFEVSDVEYRDPRWSFAERGGSAESGCGVAAADPADFPGQVVSPAFYCPDDEGAYFASGWMYRASYLEHGDFATAVVIGHEFGHHVQTLLGIPRRSSKPFELQADCLAGTWANHAERRGLMEEGDAEEGMRGAYASGDYQTDHPQHHGTPEERTKWFLTGYRSGRPGDCTP
jgi:predicted metalloprotease